jgi:hypothetical protein
MWARAVLARLRKHGVEAVARPTGQHSGGGVLFELKGVPQAELAGKLVFRVNGGGASVGLEVAPAYIDDVRASLDDPSRAEELQRALDALPEQFAVELAGEGEEDAATGAAASLDELRALLVRSESRDRPLWIGWRVPRDFAVEHRTLLDEQLQDAVVVLAGVSLFFGRRPRGRAVRRAVASGSIDRGTKVRVVDGPLSGKTGIVRELDGKGKARVMLGLLAVRMEVDNLVAYAGGRPRIRLSTSHRKPVPARS